MTWHGEAGAQGPGPLPRGMSRLCPPVSQPRAWGAVAERTPRASCTFLKSLGNRVCSDQREQQWLSLGMGFHPPRPPATRSLIHLTHLPTSPWFVLSIKGASGCLSPVRENKWVISKLSLFGRQTPSSGGRLVG